jgi:hypothetical protein
MEPNYQAVTPNNAHWIWELHIMQLRITAVQSQIIGGEPTIIGG